MSAVAALVVAAVLLGGWWLAQPPHRAEGGAVAASGGGVTGDPGSVDPGYKGSEPGSAIGADPGADLSEEPGAGQPAIGRDAVLDEGAVRIDSYVSRGKRLLLTYTSGVPECYGEVAVREVEERGDAVTVALRAVPPVAPADTCIDLAVVGTIAVDLAAPLRDRPVFDGGFEPEVLVRRG